MNSEARAFNTVTNADEASRRRSAARGQGGAQGGVHHVRRRQPVVDPGSFGRADGVLDHVDEGGHVVVGDAFAVVDGTDELRCHLGRAGPDRRRRVAGDDAHLGPALDGQELDLEPHLESGLVGEQRRHLRQRVAGDHATPAARRRQPRHQPPRAAARRCRSGTACLPSRCGPRPHRRDPGPRRWSGPAPVTPRTRPPAVTKEPSSSSAVPAWKTVTPSMAAAASSPSMRSPVRGASG